MVAEPRDAGHIQVWTSGLWPQFLLVVASGESVEEGVLRKHGERQTEGQGDMWGLVAERTTEKP